MAERYISDQEQDMPNARQDPLRSTPSILAPDRRHIPLVFLHPTSLKDDQPASSRSQQHQVANV
jgi:hypothetical protein